MNKTNILKFDTLDIRTPRNKINEARRKLAKFICEARANLEKMVIVGDITLDDMNFVQPARTAKISRGRVFEKVNIYLSCLIISWLYHGFKIVSSLLPHCFDDF